MADYTQGTGSTGTMMIRDHGSAVELWLKAGSQTYAYQLPFYWAINGSSPNGWQTFRFNSGGAWQFVTSFSLSYSATVTFGIGRSGTSGLGGPTDFSVWLNRSARPSPPSTPWVTARGYDYISVAMNDGSNNGAGIDAREIGISVGQGVYATIPGNGTFIGLRPGIRYLFLGRTHNALGWSDWGPILTAKTVQGARVKYADTWRNAACYVNVGGTWKVCIPYVRSSGSWKPGL